MIIDKLTIPRRTVLRGLGAAIALPFLDSMLPAFTSVARTAGRGAARLSIVYTGNGAALGHFAPKEEGAAYEMTPILQPLAAFRDRMLVLAGIDNPVSIAPGIRRAHRLALSSAGDLAEPATNGVTERRISLQIHGGPAFPLAGSGRPGETDHRSIGGQTIRGEQHLREAIIGGNLNSVF